MVVLNKIYTRTGDKGDTALSDGTRVAKHDPRVEAYGTVDEANSAIGVLLAVLVSWPEALRRRYPDYVADLLEALDAQGVAVDQVHPEYAPGQLELSVAAADPAA